MNQATRILVVCNKPAKGWNPSQVLRLEGYEVLETPAGQQTLQLTRDWQAGLVLWDVRHSGRGGRAIYEQLKAAARQADARVILVSDRMAPAWFKKVAKETSEEVPVLRARSAEEFRTEIRTLMRPPEGALPALETDGRRWLETLPENVVVMDPQGRLVEANRQAIATLGYVDRAELLQCTAFDLTPVADHARVRADLGTTLALGVLQNVEYTVLKKNGEAIPVGLNAAAVKEASGRPIGIMVIARDLRQRKRVEALLRDQQQLALAYIEEAMDGFWMVDHEGNIVDVNEAYCRMSGYSRRELLAKHVADLEVNEPTRAQVAAHAARILRAGSERFESRHRCKNGLVIEVEISVTCLRREKPCFCVFLRDITQRKRAEQLLQHKTEELDRYFNSALDLLCIADTNGFFRKLNPEWLNTLGYPIERLVGHRFLDLVHPDDLDATVAAVARLSEQRSVLNFVNRYRHADGTYRWIEWRAYPADKLIYAVARDITERKRIEEELRALSRRVLEVQEQERRRVARELHDGVNQLIASARMRLHRVQEREPALLPATRELLTRCSELLLEALKENRRIAHNLRPSDLDELGLAVACQNFCKEVQSRSALALDLEVPRNWQRLPSPLELNLFRITQEAIHNAEQHARAKSVQVRLAVRGSAVVLQIKDDGHGFKARANPGEAGGGRKRGTGLRNMHERAAAVGGTCKVISVPQHGTSVIVRVPKPRAS